MDNGWVYALADPRTGEIRYVGVSHQPEARINEHMNDRKNPAKRIWTDQLRMEGLEPDLIRIERTFTPCTHDEQRWIKRMMMAGNRLTNIQHVEDPVIRRWKAAQQREGGW